MIAITLYVHAYKCTYTGIKLFQTRH